MKPKATALSILALVLLGCTRATAPPPEHVEPEHSTFATILVDFSASFAPLTQTDRLALREVARALADLAVQVWSPPTVIVWRKIGGERAAPLPLCAVLEYQRRIVGAASALDRLRQELSTCVEAVVRDSRTKQEPYTDISGGVMMASESWANIPASKFIVVLSDGKEDLPNGTQGTNLRLRGETVLILHRPGNTETAEPAAYIERLAALRERLLAAGARKVALLPTFRAALPTLEQALTGQPGSGTSIGFVLDIGSTDEPHIKRAVSTVAAAVARRALTYPEPVVAGWFASARPAWRTFAVAPIVFTPRLVRRADENNDVSAFKTAIEEPGLALLQRQHPGSGDIDGSLRLITSGETATSRHIVLFSNFGHQPPSHGTTFLHGTNILMVYQPTERGQTAELMIRLAEWRGYFQRSGAATICALDLGTITESTITTCLQ